MKPLVSAIALASLLSLAACGGKSGTIKLALAVSPVDDPLTSAASVRITVMSTTAMSNTVPVANGHFTVDISLKSGSQPGTILVEALDSAGKLVAYGQTGTVIFDANKLGTNNQANYTVWIGRPGRAAPAATAFLTARAEAAATNIPGLGILYVGGRDGSGNALKSSSFYDMNSHQIVETSANGPLVAAANFARAGGVALTTTGGKIAVFGGSSASGFGSPGAPLANFEIFDPASNSWSAADANSDTHVGRAYPNAARLGSGQLLVSGGQDANGAALNLAALISPADPAHLTSLQPLAQARFGHAVAMATFPDQPGALIFGGLPDSATGPVFERLAGQTFSDYSMGLGSISNRKFSTATTLPDGRVVVLGGQDMSGALQSGFVVTPTLPATVSLLPTVLSVPRQRHTATVVGARVLVCGGQSGPAQNVASCDVIDATSLMRLETIPLSIARSGHSATTLDMGLVVIAGGVDDKGMPLSAIDLYTPDR